MEDKKIEMILDNAINLKVGQAKLMERVEGIDTRLKIIEGNHKNQVWALILLLAGALITAGFRTLFTGNIP
jgi:hypothetical protein